MGSRRHPPVKLQRLLLGTFLLYLFGVLGYLGTSHKHETSGKSHPPSHSECQLCHVTAQPYVVPEPLVCPESPTVPVQVIEAVWAPILASRFQPFSSRAPPSA
ncbi:MAG TPA: hypothetical protein VJ385_15500 [Fibrobacteria bacterium]|nr:hypothetical protein [Fibrobacteria bacterium]